MRKRSNSTDSSPAREVATVKWYRKTEEKLPLPPPVPLRHQIQLRNPIRNPMLRRHRHPLSEVLILALTLLLLVLLLVAGLLLAKYNSPFPQMRLQLFSPASWLGLLNGA